MMTVEGIEDRKISDQQRELMLQITHKLEESDQPLSDTNIAMQIIEEISQSCLGLLVQILATVEQMSLRCNIEGWKRADLVRAPLFPTTARQTVQQVTRLRGISRLCNM